ncbi:MAG: LamG domain-containing protein, partial [Bacteroidales bacterium]|nr:LamG domain-containing protein [Bacteroidales bacterium]
MSQTKPLFSFLLATILGVSTIAQTNSGLLFYLSGNSLEADVSAGKAHPNYVRNVSIIPDGAHGNAFRCAEGQLLSYWAHSNMYAQRGTLSFYWRAGIDPFTETEFPIFRVGYSDHSSWDMVWLRIDYNGAGFDAFVTDANLARIRVSHTMELPDAMNWTHFALTWDETQGIRFYVNGKLVGRRDTVIVLDASLDQFGAHSRIISPYQVQSAYNFRRGGDIDEIRVYDRALDDAEILRVSQGEDYRPAPFSRSMSDKRWKDEWFYRYGWA